MNRRRRCLWAAIAVLSLVAAGCSGGNGGSEEDESGSPSTVVIDGQSVALVPATVPVPLANELQPEFVDRIQAAIAAGGEYNNAHLDEVDPALQAINDYLWRNWAVKGLEDARATGQAEPKPEGGEELLLLRLIHSDVSRPDVPADIEAPPMFWALHCDQEGLPPEFVNDLAEQVRQGRPFDLAHAAYAMVFVGELGCEAPDLTSLASATVDALARELNAIDATAPVTLDGLLLSVGLTYLGRADLVPASWLERVVDAQRLDGGWAEVAEADESSWHATGLALWTLAGAVSTGEGVPMVIID